MSRLKVTVPFYASVPDDFRFTHENGGKSRGMTLNSLMQGVTEYRRTNHLPIPEDMQAIVEDQICRVLPPGFCKFEDNSTQKAFVSKRISRDDIVAGMKTLASVVINQRTVEPEEAERRAAICTACPANDTVEGCFGCVAMEDTIGAIIGAKKTKSDPYLRVCLACHCFNKAQVWVDERDFKGTSDEQFARLSLFPHCWKFQLLSEQRLLDKAG